MDSAKTNPLSIPRIETERLMLRGPELRDFSDSFSLWSEEAVYRYITKRPPTEAEAWGRLHRYVGHWALLGFGFWAVIEKTSGKFVGEIGFGDHRRAMEPSIHGIPELGWVLKTEAQGKGYATEALRAVTAWGDSHFESPRTCCIIDPENLASHRVAHKLGFTEEAKASFLGEPVILYFRTR